MNPKHPNYAYHRDASRTFMAVREANKPYKAAADEIIKQFSDHLHVLAPKCQLAIRSVDSLYLACPEPEDLVAFKEACIADVSTYKTAADEIMKQFSDRLHVLAPKRQLAIRSLDSLYLACSKPEDLVAFKEACIADDSTTEYLGSRRVKKGIDFTANRKSRTNAIKKARFSRCSRSSCPANGSHQSGNEPEVDWASGLDEDDMEFVAVEDPVQPIKAIKKVDHSDADERQFEVEETFFGYEAEDTNVEFEAGDMPFIAEDEDVEAVDEPQFDVEEAFFDDEDGNDEVVLHAHRNRGSRMIKVCC
jgi:hypothetical protein